LSQQKKARKVGRPKMPKGEAKGRIVPVRFNADDIKAITAAARDSNQSLSEWIRGKLMAAIKA
jgi:predicted HicB family RNase H-like nuclease